MEDIVMDFWISGSLCDRNGWRDVAQ